MSSFVITVNSPKNEQTLINAIQSASATQSAVKLSQFFRSVASGTESASLSVSTSSNNPVAASGSFTLTYASISANDTCIIGKTTLTAKTTAPANESEFRKETDLATTVANLIAVINAHSVIGKIVTASSSSAGVVTLTAKQPGLIGNEIGLTGSTGIVRSATYLASGSGGSNSVPVSYSLGL